MKWRNQLLALFCLLAFLALGVLYFKNWVVQKPFGIILFVGEGLDPQLLAAARIYAGGADRPLHLDSLDCSALLKNYSVDSATPDQAAAATALATGTKVRDGALGLGADEKALSNLMELARQSGRMTGLVTDVRLTEPTAAAFYAHAASGDDRQAIARQLAEEAKVDVILGGGAAEFLPPAKGGIRADERDLTQQMQGAGYELVRTVDDLEAIPRWRRAKLIGLFSPGELGFEDEEEKRMSQPNLADMVRRAIELLQFNRDGYFLVVDAGLMRKAAQANEAERRLRQTMELDRAIGAALEYTGNKSTIFVCGDVGLGGMTLNGFIPRERSGAVWTGSPAPSLLWSSGPKARLEPVATPTESPGPPPNETNDTEAGIAAMTPTAAPTPAPTLSLIELHPTAGDVIALGNGPGAEALHGIMESTRVFEIIQDNL